MEPILQENKDRFVLFPIKHKEIWEMYKKAEILLKEQDSQLQVPLLLLIYCLQADCLPQPVYAKLITLYFACLPEVLETSKPFKKLKEI